MNFVLMLVLICNNNKMEKVEVKSCYDVVRVCRSVRRIKIRSNRKKTKVHFFKLIIFWTVTWCCRILLRFLFFSSLTRVRNYTFHWWFLTDRTTCVIRLSDAKIILWSVVGARMFAGQALTHEGSTFHSEPCVPVRKCSTGATARTMWLDKNS